jgi:hypothetical protein
MNLLFYLLNLYLKRLSLKLVNVSGYFYGGLSVSN